jgi:tetratricopeptide (TPR) repeat protein
MALRVPGLEAAELGAMDSEDVNLLLSAGRFERALALIDAALPRCARLHGQQDQNCRMLFLRQGQTLLRLGKLDQAQLALPRLDAMSRDMTLPFIQVESLILEFRLRSRLGSAPEVPGLFERVRAFGESGAEVSMKPSFKAIALLALSEARLQVNDPSQTIGWAEAAMGLMNSGTKSGDGLRISAIAQTLMGVALIQQHRYEDALAALGRAQTAATVAFGASHPTTQTFAMNSALALSLLDRTPEALEIARKAEPMLREAMGADSPTYRRALEVLRQLEASATDPAKTNALSPKTQLRRQAGPSLEQFFT